VLGLFGVLALYLLLAFVFVPAAWRLHYRHPAVEESPRITRTKDGRPGDPLNIALVGHKKEIVQLLVAANWQPADEISFNSCRRIVTSTVLRRPYDKAPVSPLCLNGRVQDLAFQQMIGNSPAKRHHVRFWESDELDEDGRPLWFGAATEDVGVKPNPYNGQPTHRIAQDVDRERDKLLEDLNQTQQLLRVTWVRRFHQILAGKNGCGDPWRTDGHLIVAVIAPGNGGAAER
jgi:hypothetical protein